ncbi:MAG: hypothetical protein ABIH23_29945, partial [bacterium]
NRLFTISFPHQNGYGVSVIDEGPDFSDKNRRFKVAWWGQEKPWPDGDPGMRVAFSPDGIHWTPWEKNPVLPDFGEPQFLNDPRRPYGAADMVDVYMGSDSKTIRSICEDTRRARRRIGDRREGGLFHSPAG